MENINEKTNKEVYFWNSISTKDKALFYEHLSNLVGGGVTVVNALESFLEKTTNPKLSKEIMSLLIFIDSGDSFSIAMKKIPETFDKKEIAIIEAGESSGTMQRSFEVLSIQLREQEELKQKAKGALTYPMIIMVFLVIAVIIIMTYVIPKLMPIFETTQTKLPLATRSLKYTSDFITGNLLLIIILFVILAIAYNIYKKTYNGKRTLDSLYLRLPLVGKVYKNYIIAQISSNLGLLLGAGIPIIKTLKLTGEGSNNIIYNEAIDIISQKVASGKKITQSIEETDPERRFFPNDFVQIIAAGEKTSTINKVCEKLKEQYRREVEYSIGIMIKWIEPIAILIAGIFVLWFAFAIFSAVLQITETVGV